MLDFLVARFPGVETVDWLARMERGQVVDETGLRLNPNSPYRVGACVYYYRELPAENRVPFTASVLYQDEHILVADKPHFLPVIPAGRFLRETLLVRLKRESGLNHLTPIHRLDRETAGIVLFSLNPATRGVYASMFQRREVEKVYEAHARGLPGLEFPVTRRSRIVAGAPFFRMREVEGEANAETRIELVKELGEVNLYRLLPITGRKHQLRLHLSALGMPVVNDNLYPNMRDAAHDDYTSPLKLLAKSIAFRDPLTGHEHYFESERQL